MTRPFPRSCHRLTSASAAPTMAGAKLITQRLANKGASVRRWLRQGYPHLASEPGAARVGQEPRRADQRASPVGHPRPGGGRVKPGDRDTHQVAATVGLPIQDGGNGPKDGCRGARAGPPECRGEGSKPGDKAASVSHV